MVKENGEMENFRGVKMMSCTRATLPRRVIITQNGQEKLHYYLELVVTKYLYWCCLRECHRQ